MIPYILAAVGGYLIGDSLKGKQFAEGGRIWSEIRSDFEDDGYVYIDGFISEDDNEEGKVIAKVRVPDADFPLDKNYAEVLYLDDRAKTDSFAQEVIQEVLDSLKREHRTHMPPPTPSYAKGGMMANGDSLKAEQYAEGGMAMMANGGRIKVGTFSEEQLKNKEDKKAVEKAQKESGLTYVDTKIIKKGGKMYLDVYLIPNEEYYNSSKYADGGMMGGMIKKWELKPNGRYYATFLIDKKDPKYREIVEHGVTESIEEVDGCYEIIISVTEKGKEYFENNFVNSGYMASGGMMAKG